MDEIKVKYLITMAKKYLNSTLKKNEKENILNVSQSLFYQVLYESSVDSEFNKRLLLFAVMAKHFSQDKVMCRRKAESLKEMIEYFRAHIKFRIFSNNVRAV